MRIRATFILEINPDTWAQEYAIGDVDGHYTAKEIRQSVVDHVLTYAQTAVTIADDNNTAEVAK
jgi:hypothetical protein